MSSLDTEQLYALLPAIYHLRDAASGYPLKALVDVLATQGKIVEGDIQRLYENWFIETCEEWVVPYLGDLMGVRGLLPPSRAGWSQRALVANTLRYRQRKGTLPLLEQLAYDVANWAARAVELYNRVGVTQYLDHLRPGAAATADLETLTDAAVIGSPFDPLTYTADVRLMSGTRQAPQLEAQRPAPPRGRQLAGVGQARPNLPNIGLYIWRLKPYRIEQATAYSYGDGRRFSFSPVGNDLPLYQCPQSARDWDHAALPWELPVALRREALQNEEMRTGFFRPPAAFEVYPSGTRTPLAPDQIVIADLANWNAPLDSAHPLAVDPELGRILFRNLQDTEQPVRTTYTYAFSDAIGGGPYDRPAQALAQGDIAIHSADPDALARALATWNGQPAIHLGTNATYRMPEGLEMKPTQQQIQVRAYQLYVERGRKDADDWADWFRAEAELTPRPVQTIHLNGRQLVIQAVNGFRPTIAGDLEVFGDTDAAQLTLSGLLIAGQVRIRGRLGKLTILDSTLVPGIRLNPYGVALLPLAPSVVATDHPCPSLELDIERSIVGPLCLPNTIHGLTIRDSIVDAAPPATQTPSAATRLPVSPYSGAASRPVLTAPQPPAIPGLATTLGEREYTWGPVTHLERVTIFGRVQVSGLSSAVNVLFTDPVRVDLSGGGEIANCYLPAGSNTPTLWRNGCLDGSQTPPPAFVVRRYGAPGYAQLSLACPPEIRTGGVDGTEIGVFQRLAQPQREGALLAQVEEYLRFGFEAGLIYVN